MKYYISNNKGDYRNDESTVSTNDDSYLENTDDIYKAGDQMNIIK